MEGSAADRQGAAAQPRRLHRPRVELHLSHRSQPRGRDADPGEPAPVCGAGRQHHVRRDRGGAHRGPPGGTAPAEDIGARLGHRGRAADAGRGRREGAVRQRRCDPGRLLHAERVGGRLGPCRRHHARAGAGARRAHRAGQHRGHRAGGGAAAVRPPAYPRRADRGGCDRSGAGCDRVRRLESASCWNGRRDDPAHPGGAPDGEHGPDRHPAQDGKRDRLSDRARHGHVHVRAAEPRGDGGRLLRPSPHPRASRRHSFPGGGGADSHRDALHCRRLRAAARTRPRDHGRAARRLRHAVRGQRPAVADPRRAAGAGRDRRGGEALVGGGGLGQGGARDRAPDCRVDHAWPPAPVRSARIGRHALLPARARGVRSKWSRL